MGQTRTIDSADTSSTLSYGLSVTFCRVRVVAQTRRESSYFDEEPEPAKAEDVPAAQQVAPMDPAQMQQLMQMQMQQQMMMMSQMQDPQQVRVFRRLNPPFCARMCKPSRVFCWLWRRWLPCSSS